VVSRDRIAEFVAGGLADGSTVRTAVSRVRKVLGERVVTDGDGYRLVLAEPDSIDASRFEDLISRARTLAAGERRDVLDRAVRLWKGRAFDGFSDEPWAQGYAARLDELRIVAVEDLAEVLSLLGRHGEAVSLLEAELIESAEAQFRERPVGLLMQALAASGRTAEALRVFQRLRMTLRDELGIDPSAELRAIEARILSGFEPDHDTAPAPTSTLPRPLVIRADDPPFVGRRDEVTDLEHHLRAAIDGGQPVLDIVVGEAGVGKTRLVAEAASTLFEQGTLVLFGRCGEFVGSAFEPLEQGIDHLVDSDPEVFGSAEALDRARELMRRMSAVSLAMDGESTPQADLHQLLEDTSRVLEHLASRRAVVLVIDDLHWASRPTVLALSHLLRRSARVRLAVVATARVPEFGGADVVGTLGREPGVRLVRLGGLAVDDVREYLSIIGVDPAVAERSVEHLRDRTGGNAFMLGELVRATAPAFDDEASVPELVRDVIVERARRLPGPALELLQMASVAGLDFELDLLTSAAELPESVVSDALEAAASAQLVVEQSSRRLTYAFTHAITRDAFAAGLTNARRSRCHAQLGVALERSSGERTPLVIGRLAYHFLACGDAALRTAGCRYAVEAGERAMAGFAYDDACEWFGRAIEELRDLGADPALIGRANLALAQAATLAGDEPTARRSAESAWQLALEGGDREVEVAAALLYAGEPELNVVGDEPGVAILAATLEHPDLLGGDRARIMARLGSALSYTEHDRATSLAVGAIELARREGAPTDLAYAIRCRLRGWFEPDEVEARMAIADELRSIGRELGDGVTEAWGWRWGISVRFDCGAIAEIEFGCERLAELGEILRLPNQQWAAAIRLAGLRIFQGKFDDADRCLDVAASHEEHIDNMLTTTNRGEVEGRLAWLRGELVVAEPSVDSTVARLDDRMIWLRVDPTPAFDAVAADPESILDWDLGRLDLISALALAMRDHPHEGAARAVYPYARRHAHLVANLTPPGMMLGSMQLYAGILARVAGDRVTAIDHLRAAVVTNDEMGALPFVALSLHELANTLPDGDEARDARARSSLIAADVGIPWLVDTARSS
jgi:DNA-binding SARP family transcriptional activator